MFARLTTGQMKTDRLDEAVKLYEESVLPLGKQKKGRCGTYYLIDRTTGKTVVMSLWDSEDDAIATEKSGYYQEQVNKFKDFYIGAPVRERYEVRLQA